VASEIDALNGVWRLVSAQVRMEDTGETVDVHGPDPVGYAIFEPGGRVMFLITPAGRARARDDAAAAAHLRGMTAYTGRYRIEGDQVVTAVDAAWLPGWENSEQRRYFELAGDTLTLKTPVQEHPSHPGRKHRGVFAWVREGP
jgi:Lipocalin-like domain